MTLLKELDGVSELYVRPNEATRRVLEHNLSSLFVSNDDESSEVTLLVKRNALADLLGENYVAGERDEHQTMYCEAALRNIDSIVQEAVFHRYTALSEGLKVFLIRKANSNLPMTVSHDMFATLCSSAHVPTQFWDFLLHMGEKEHEVEISPPPVVCRVFGEAGAIETRWHLMGCIRLVEPNRRRGAFLPSAKWSLRQSAFFCCFEPTRGQTNWVLVALADPSVRRSEDIWSKVQDPARLLPFRVIYSWYEYATSNWRPYAVALAQEVDTHESNSLGATPDDTGPVPMMRAGERQALTALDIKLASARLALQSMLSDVTSLAHICEQGLQYMGSKQVNEMQRLGQAFHDSSRDLERNIMRIEQLQARLRNVTNLVSTFLELNSAHILQQLGKQSHIESENMRKLAERSTQDSAKITVLTILTLTYLPLTVVSNFFSTSFVGTTADHIYITNDWWLLLVTSLPLTLLTFYVWWVWSNIKAHEDYPSWWPRWLIKQSMSDHME
ncbi:uncharacterized protein HMPREF1541_05405 [Cyphellophora europaea CBS 101466]|uniref:Uncharacterized protein n=1 Tax=Cyphellophora europaea (strain CBS 101466) TaxID=1220924 RepID=W2RRU2_CYPE1|nr:uncharacterized protein HMPREF1541_05405 [Cyphellophora europaea CBS 101466]ETN39182.1 hypothetical protein HMPREF1541_05405 [Cyphellophora europaea CBS 101466]